MSCITYFGHNLTDKHLTLHNEKSQIIHTIDKRLLFNSLFQCMQNKIEYIDTIHGKVLRICIGAINSTLERNSLNRRSISA